MTQYYNLNDNGFGTILAFNSQKQSGIPPFGSPDASDDSNPSVQVGLWGPGVPTAFQPRYTSFSFSPQGLINLTAFSHGEDMASSLALDGGYAGKVTQPAAAPNDDMLLVWTPGPANNLDRPTPIPYYDAGIYLLSGGKTATDYRQLVKIKNDPNYNELQPKAVVPYSAIYGIAQPAAIPFLPNDGSLSPLLPAGTPFGLIGTSSFYNRNTTPGYGVAIYNGLDSFNTTENGDSSNWFEQGADGGLYTNDDIFAVRILALEGVAHRSYPNGSDTGFINFSNAERLRILGEIPVRKPGVTDAQGNPDTSFLAKIPADTPFSFQTLDKNGLVLNMAQTWHMVRPGEVRNNCGGCHAHHQLPLDFQTTAAAKPTYQVPDLTAQSTLLTKDASGNTVGKNAGRLMVDVEYYKDVKPILQRSCVQCHSKSGNAAAGLVLDDTTLVNGFDNTYNRLANDSDAQWGIPPVIALKAWRQSNASRYVRMFQSRRSLLVWKIFGQRLDGWANAAHPTESTPGDASTLPGGADPNAADIDFTGTIMPPPGSNVPPLTEDEKMTIARWVDLGAPITAQGDTYKGYFADEIKPTVALSLPRAGSNASPLAELRVGLFDAYSGINAASLSVKTNFGVNGAAAGAELGPSFVTNGNSIWRLPLTTAITNIASGHIVVSVKDNSGNATTVDRWFSVGSGGGPQPVTVSPSSATLRPSGTQQFTATPSAVAWSITPMLGTISPTGLYTAPASIATQQNITVTATSNVDSSQFASAVVMLKPPVPVRWSISGAVTGISSAMVTLSGAASATTALGAGGSFSFSGLANGSYTITPSAAGFSFTPASRTVTVNNAAVTGVSFNAKSLPAGSGAGHLHDFAGNGRSGAIIYDASNGQEYTALSNGDGTYTYVANLFTSGFDTLRTGDYNGDGKSDLILYNKTTALAYIGMSKGDGTFTFQSLFWSPGYAVVEAGDLNGDGTTDIALYNTSTGTMYTGISNGDGTFTYKYTLISKGYTTLRLADFNGDGKADIFVYRASDGIASVGIGDGLGGFVFTSLSISSGYNLVDIGDLNGDGKADLILYNAGNGNAATGVSTGAGFNFTPLLFSVGFTSLNLGNYRGAGRSDLTLYNANNGNAYFGVGNGAGNFTFQSLFWSPGYNSVVPQDVNGDGKTDVVLFNSTTGTEYTGISAGSGALTYTYGLWGKGKLLAR